MRKRISIALMFILFIVSVSESKKATKIISEKSSDKTESKLKKDLHAKLASQFRLTKKGEKSYRVTFKFTLYNPSLTLTKLVVVLPYPEINMTHYQKISNLTLSPGWKLQYTPTQERYARLEIDGNNNIPQAGQTKSYSYSFNVTLNGIESAGDVNSTVTSTVDKQNSIYIGHDQPYVNPANSEIIRISNRLWNESNGQILLYANKAYEYVSANYAYRDAYTGLHKLSDIIAAGGGDCGNLSSVFISLIQAKNIPARHAVAVSPRNNFHAWAEFYLDRIGWVPVDVTYKKSNSRGNYFGNYNVNDAHIVLHKRPNMSVIDINGNSYVAPILQSFLYWVHGEGNEAELRPTFTVTSQQI